MVRANDESDAAAVEENEPLPQRVGPYRIVGVLGRGGMGVVYRGAHAVTGEPAAIKTVLAHSVPMLASIRREIHALSLLRHPGVVRILETGVSEGLPWYGMELLEGRTMRSYVHEIWTSWREASTATVTVASTQIAPDETAALEITSGEPVTSPAAALRVLETGPADAGVASPASRAGAPIRRFSPPRGQPLGVTLTLLRRLCEPLAYLHGEGIVHLDLKPENIFIEKDGTPVLVDLGIASQFRGEGGRDVIETRTGLTGTCPYMSPEQIRGDLVDARADLYALGCILYEFLTGSPPFAGSVATVLHHHLTRTPLPPSALVRGIGPALDELVMKLLQKRPADRVGYASDVAAALERAGASPPGGRPLPRPNAYLYRPGLWGRQKLRHQVQAAVVDAAAGKGRVVFLGGESGAGKTRLAMEGAREAARRGMLVIAGQGVALGADARQMRAAPLHPLRPLLTTILDRCRVGGAAETARVLGARGRSLAAFEPALAELPGQGELPEPPPLDARAARARLLSHLKGTLLALAAEAPVLLLIDDLQWADDLSLGLVAELTAEDLSGHSLLVVGVYRMEERDAPLAELVASPHATSIELPRLDDGSVAAMVGDMLALPAGPPELVDFITRRSGGNPLFVSEHLLTAVEQGMLMRDAEGRWQLRIDEGPASFDSRVPLPRSLAALLEGRLAQLSPEDRGLAEAAAVLGRDLEPHVLQLAAGVDERAALEGTERLRVRQILEDVGGRLRFVHDKLREALQASLPADRLRAQHRAAAGAIEAVHGAVPDMWPALAHHYVQAGVPERAIDFLTRAGDRARAAAAVGEAATYYREAIDQASAAGAAPDGDRLLTLRERLGDVLTLAGSQGEAREAFLAAASATPAERRIDASRLHRKVGKTYETAHAHDEALAAYAEAGARLGAAPADAAELAAFRREWISIRIDSILAHYWIGHVDAMEGLIEEVGHQIDQGGLAAERARFFDALLHMALRRERFLPSDGTLEYARRALEAGLESGDAATEGWARFMLVFTLLFHRALPEAEEQARLGLARAERAGDVILLARYQTYLVFVLRLGGREGEVRVAAERALSLASGAGMLDYVAAARANQAWLACREGRRDEAERLSSEARSGWAALAVTYPFQWTALFPALCCALDRGDVPRAAELAGALLDEGQARLPDEVAGPLRTGSRSARAGDVTGARAALAGALAVARSLGYA